MNAPLPLMTQSGNEPKSDLSLLITESTITRLCSVLAYFDHTAIMVEPLLIDHLFLPFGMMA
jgi:hypothetical protein